VGVTAPGTGPRERLDPREQLARLVSGLVHIEIGRDWDAARINLVFDRLERLIDRLERRD
jgi:hypothetical protein